MAKIPLFYTHSESGHHLCNMIGIEAWWIISFRENNAKDTGDIPYRILPADDKRLMKNVSKGIRGIINGANSRLDELFWRSSSSSFKGMF